MKDIETAKRLIELLKSESENEFELHRVEVLEHDLIQGLPEAQAVDEQHQQFNGTTFKLNPGGHYTTSISIHRAVWMYYNGEIPDGREIHHVDFNKSNNDISNLQLLTRLEHRKLHNPKGFRHGQPFEKEFTCDVCGKKYVAFDTGQKTHYCSKYCLEQAKHERLIKVLTCPNCGREFTARKFDNRTRFCSKQCAREYNHNQAIETKICPVCGKSFECFKYRNQECCSRECGVKWRTIKQSETRVCADCGKEFLATKRSNKRFCDECIEAHQSNGRKQSTKLQDRYQQAYEERTCPICNSKFSVSKRVEQECCSRSCRSKLRYLRETAQAIGAKRLAQILNICTSESGLER